MSNPVKRGAKYRHAVMIKGVRHTGTFDTKTEARIWAAELLKKGGTAIARSKRKVSDIFERYAEERSIEKGGKRWEIIRLAALAKMALGSVSLDELNATHIAAWRDERLKSVQGATVKREWSLLSAAFNISVNEWMWLDTNPMSKVTCPQDSPPRDKLYTQAEIDRLQLSFGSDMGLVTGRVGAAFMFAMETGMRAGEIVNLMHSDLYLDERYVNVTGLALGGKKTASAKRGVPLTTRAVEIVRSMPSKSGKVFDIDSRQADRLFRKVAKAAMVDGHFHDSRHYAATRLSDKLSVMELARALGLKDLRTLINVYYEKKASDMATKLD